MSHNTRFQSLLSFSIFLIFYMTHVIGKAQHMSYRNKEYEAILNPIIHDSEYCLRPWPTISIFVPVNIKPYKNDMHVNTGGEWADILLSSYLQFWPISISESKVVIMIDDEAVQMQDGKYYKDFQDTLAAKFSNFPNAKYSIVTNNFDEKHWKHGRWRQQMVGFYADQYTDSKFIAYVDGDTYFTTYVDREDLFEDGKPIVRPRFGDSFGNWFVLSAEWLFGGLSEPAKCMSYFPVLIKAAHIKLMREYIEQLHGKPFQEVFKHWLDANFQGLYAHFDAFCVYIWNFHRDEYAWHGYDTKLKDTEYFSSTQQLIESNFTVKMLLPRPQIANHLPYHEGHGNLQEYFFRGVCHGPPFPKQDEVLENWCRSVTDNEFTYYMHEFEHKNSDTELKRPYLEMYDKYRHGRIANCHHTYDFKLMNFKAILSHMKNANPNPSRSLPYDLK